MSWPAASSHATGRAIRGPSAATLLLLREADATMSPDERDAYAGVLLPEKIPTPTLPPAKPLIT